MFARFRTSAWIALVALVITACSPDRAVAPTDRWVGPNGSSADIGDIAVDPTLYSQTSDINALNSAIAQGTTFVADEFVVPAGQVWTIKSLIISGQLDRASLPFTISADKDGHPSGVLPTVGRTPDATDAQTCCRSVTDYLFKLTPTLTLSAGTYWLVFESAIGSEETFPFQRTATAQGSVVKTTEDGGASWETLGAQGIAFSVFGTVKLTQSIAFNATTPNAAKVGTSANLTVTATSGLSVTLAAGPSNVCTLTGTTVTFVGVGTCTITANQAGNAQYLAAPQATHDIEVTQEDVPELLPQTITFPAIVPNPSFVGSTVPLGASATSNLGVIYTSLTPDICMVIDDGIWFRDSGKCTVAADQPGNDTYAAAHRETQSVDVVRVPQTIIFTSTPPAPGYVKGTYVVGATGGGSGFAVVITTTTPNVCTVAGTMVQFVGVGTCVVAANQPGNIMYAPAAQVTQTIKVDYRFVGFADPVKNNGSVNSANAGKTIPLKWRITDATGAPVTTLTSAAITVTDLSCATGSTANLLDESTAGASGLQNLGDGYYQLNWKTPASYARSCKTLQLDLGEGSGTRTARFAFTK